jgi:hypothetical protein
MPVILIVLCLSFVQTVKSQTEIPSPYTLADTIIKLKPGIYMSFDEFKYNRPSETVPFTVNTKDRTYHFGDVYTHYQIVFTNPADKKRLTGFTPIEFYNTTDTIRSKSIWGFSDGNYAYIAGNSQAFGKDNYDRIVAFGRYTVFNEFHFASGGAMMGGSMMGGHGKYVSTKLIDMVTGKIYYLQPGRVKKILASDPELLIKYKAEKKKGQVAFYYIQKFNERHKVKLK